MITRRRLLAFAPLPLALFAGAAPALSLPVEPAGLIGCLESWRSAPVAWADGLAADAASWAATLADAGGGIHHAFAAGDTFLGLASYEAGAVVVGECVAGGQPNWGEAFNAWVDSPRHLAVMRDPAFGAVGMAGVERPGSRHRWYWCLRLRSA